jgi:hypothetical protein
MVYLFICIFNNVFLGSLCAGFVINLFKTFDIIFHFAYNFFMMKEEKRGWFFHYVL